MELNGLNTSLDGDLSDSDSDFDGDRTPIDGVAVPVGRASHDGAGPYVSEGGASHDGAP